MPYCINETECTACGLCDTGCSAGAIFTKEEGRRSIDRTLCTGCGSCAEVCPIECIENS